MKKSLHLLAINMTKRMLLAKIHRPGNLDRIKRTVFEFLEDLDAKAEITGIVAGKWPEIEISGEDEGIATSYIAREIGFCPEKLQTVEEFAILKGYVTSAEEERGISVDVGVFEPSAVDATIPLSHLRAQLVDGRSLETKGIAELYGFCKDLPIQVKVTEVDQTNIHMEAELSTMQVLRLKSWIESLMDRLIVVGATYGEVQKALCHGGLKRDVVDIESLGVLEHALACKLGTDAVGLVSIIGRRLGNAKLTVFNSRRLWKAQ